MNKKILIYGKHACLAVINNPKRKLGQIYITKETLAELSDIKGYKLCTRQEIEKIIGKVDPTHQGIAIEVDPLARQPISAVDTNSKIILALDQINDPHNVGAICRSAAAFGVEYIITTKDNGFSESAALLKAASGTYEMVNFIETANLNNAFEKLKKEGYWIIGLDGYAKDYIATAKQFDKVVIVLGSEGDGLRRLTKENCDLLVKISISSKVESLNVSNATAITLYELAKNIQ
ncbi:MAG: 23S rRNA (guanosine(2251)-2'-O)-methyltransferase RlmB [Gammaproteobacteria bacterium]